MRKITLTSALVIMLVLPSLATAVTLESLSGTADCNSWSADLTINFRMFAMMGRVEYAVVLRDTDGAELERFDFAEFIEIPETATATYTYSGVWSTALDGVYTVTGDFVVYDIFGDGYNMSTDSFSVELVCGSVSDDPDPDACLHRSPYWAANPGQWPVTSLELGGRTSTQDVLMQLLLTRNGRPLGLMVRELIAAKLNLASGGGEDILPVIAKADALLMKRPSGRRNNIGRTNQQAVVLRRALFRYNRSGCPDGNRTGMTEALTGGFDETTGKAAVEVENLGTIKAMYR
jgi:hypothetical protein